MIFFFSFLRNQVHMAAIQPLST